MPHDFCDAIDQKIPKKQKMIRKNLYLIFLFLGLITFYSCCNEETVEVTITGIETRALILDGNNLIDVDAQNSINKEDLIMEVQILETEVIASLNKFQKKSSDSNVLESAVVPCGDQIFIYKNRIESIRVDILDVDNNNQRIDVTNQLVIRGSQQTISEFLSENNEGLRDFYLMFADVSNIPGRIEYDINVTLSDGLTYSVTEGIINVN